METNKTCDSRGIQTKFKAVTFAIMKLIIVLVSIASLSFLTNQKELYYQIDNDPCQAILDSARVAAENGQFTIQSQGRAVNEERFNSVSIWMEHRPYSEFKCLLRSEDRLYRMFGYLNSCQSYLDSVDRDYSFILEDTTSLLVITPDGVQDAHITIGAFLKIVHDQAVRDNANFAKRPLMESKVNAFIKKYAKYPSSYGRKSFPFFSIGNETGQEVTEYRLRHLYNIENIKGKKVEVMSEFVFDPELNIQIIARDSTNLYKVSSPEVSEWFNEFGRKLSKKDSIELKLRN
jgi:hypothetical protein